VVESTALEMRHTGNRIGGSNPSLSASLRRFAASAGKPATPWPRLCFPALQRGTFPDPLIEVLRKGARAMLAQAVEPKSRPLRQKIVYAVSADAIPAHREFTRRWLIAADLQSAAQLPCALSTAPYIALHNYLFGW
jgi:hypothetical protein